MRQHTLRARDRSTRSALALDQNARSADDREQSDGLIRPCRVRSDPKIWESRPCGTPYRWDSTLALVVRCHPIARAVPNSDHAMRHIFGDRSSFEDRSRQPPTHSPSELDTFRLILPEDIAIG